MSEQQIGNRVQSTNPSGGILKKFKDRRSKDQPVLGAIEAFGGLIYKVNTQDQAEMYVRTTEKLAEYVLTTFGKDMRNLVKYTTEREFTEPEFPSRVLRDTDRLHEVKYKESLAKYHRELDTYNDQKTKVFGVILGQCSPMVKDRLAKNKTFPKVEMDSDVIGLIKMLQEMAFSTLGHQEPNWAMVTVLRRLLNLQQHKHDTIQNYYLRFKSQATVLEAQWGIFYPPRLVDSLEEVIENDKTDAQEAILTAIFVSNSDNGRFRSLKERLNNEYLSGTDNYPKTLEQAVNLLTYNQDYGAKVSRSDKHDDIDTGSGFAQKHKKSGKGPKKSNQDDNITDDENDNTPHRRARGTSQSTGWSA
jgi:hypothetical protein